MTAAEVNELSTADLKALIAKREKTEQSARERERVAYEKARDREIEDLMKEATYLAERMEAFKRKCHTRLEEQVVKLESYGKIRGNSKGGFSITHTKGGLRITRVRSTEPYWDERGLKAIDLIKEFLHDTVRKRDIKLFEILISFLEKNKAGDLEYNRVFGLLQHEDKFDDPRWLEGLKLLKESYSVRFRGYGYEFKQLDSEGKWDNLTLNFSSI